LQLRLLLINHNNQFKNNILKIKMDEYRYDEMMYEKNSVEDQYGWNCFTDVANARDPEFVQNFLQGNWIETPTDDIVPSNRAVGIKNVFYKPGNELKIQITGTEKFKTDVKNVLMTGAQPFINLKFNFVDSGGNITIDNNYTGGGVARGLGSQKSSISISSAQTGLVLHEFGHALGMHHEMKNPNIKITWIESVLVQMFGNADFVNSQITSSLPANSVTATAFDKNSVMIYPLPARTNKEGIAMDGVNKYTDLDRQWLTMTYGQPQQPPPSTQRTQSPPSTQRTQSPPSTQRTQSPPSTQRTQSPPSTQRSQPPPSTQRTQPPPSTQRTQPPPSTQRTQPPSTQTAKPQTTKPPSNTVSPQTNEPKISESWIDNVILILISLFVKN
jgi:hypothetical protein